MNSLKYSLIIICFSLLTFPQAHAQLFSGLNKIQNAPLHAGSSGSFDKDFKTVIKASRESLIESGMAMESAKKIDENTFMLIGKVRTGLTTWGEFVRITVIKNANRKTTVWVYSQRAVKVNITAKADYANTILSNLDMKLNM